jgi:hypothetical protein
LDSVPGSFYPSCELYLLICEQVGWGEDGVLAEYLLFYFYFANNIRVTHNETAGNKLLDQCHVEKT